MLLFLFTFHYVYIYILPLCRQNWFIKIIYIPLCLYLYDRRGKGKSYRFLHLHSTMFVLLYRSIVNNLHSTMFIFIFLKHLKFLLILTFTFHYVYIYIKSMPDMEMFLLSFTFHYVYIYIGCRLSGEKDHEFIYIPLCLYLYSVSAISIAKCNIIYIPLCLYLYPSLIISCIFTACNTIYCLPVKSKQLFTFLILVFSLYSSIFIEYSTFVVLPVF